MTTDLRTGISVGYVKNGTYHREHVGIRGYQWRKLSNDNFKKWYEVAANVAQKHMDAVGIDDVSQWDFWFNCVPVQPEETETYLRNRIKSWILEEFNDKRKNNYCVIPRFSHAYSTLMDMCFPPSDDGNYLGDILVSYIFSDLIKGVGHNRWILKDGSSIAVDFGAHCTLVEEILKLREQDVEQMWVKVSSRTVYTHPNMTDAQWDVVAKMTANGNYCEDRRLWDI